MYLSRVEINLSNRRAMHDLTHLGAFHGWVERSFPAEIAQGIRRRHLWRIDRLNGHTYLLLLSPDKPDQHYFGRYAVPGTVQTVDYDQLLNSLAEEQIRPFRLTANVVKRRGHEPAVALHSVPDLEKWLLYHVVDHGFEIATDDDGNFEMQIRDHHSEPLQRGSRRVQLSLTSYEGLLKITDVELFKQALAEGIGREKAFGCGLLTVMPPVKK